jgi:hypothetical protein
LTTDRKRLIQYEFSNSHTQKDPRTDRLPDIRHAPFFTKKFKNIVLNLFTNPKG